MHDPIHARYPYASLTEALVRFVNVRQGDRESLLDYVKWFKQWRNVLKSHVGKHILDEFVSSLEEFHNLTDPDTAIGLSEPYRHGDPAEWAGSGDTPCSSLRVDKQ